MKFSDLFQSDLSNKDEIMRISLENGKIKIDGKKHYPEEIFMKEPLMLVDTPPFYDEESESDLNMASCMAILNAIQRCKSFKIVIPMKFFPTYVDQMSFI